MLYEVITHMKCGQPEEAVYALELAVLANPKRMELQHELLSLYRSTYNEKGFDSYNFV